jgi:hypothetical protein
MVEYSQEELVRRRPVWAAMSTLFLDTETRPSLARVALTCLESGYGEDELEGIWCKEISPVLGSNLFSVAGEWSGFDLDQLEEAIVGRRRGLLDRVWARSNSGDWKEIRRLMGWLKDWPEAHRFAVATAVGALMSMALSDIGTGAEDLSDLNPEERQRIWKDGAEPLLTALHVKDFDPPLAEIIRRVDAVLS